MRTFGPTVTVSPRDSPEGPSSILFHCRPLAVSRMKRGRSDEGSRHTPIIADGIGSPWPAASYQPSVRPSRPTFACFGLGGPGSRVAKTSAGTALATTVHLVSARSGAWCEDGNPNRVETLDPAS